MKYRFIYFIIFLYCKKDNKFHSPVYRFYNLIANFSDRFFNTSLDQSKQTIPTAIIPIAL